MTAFALAHAVNNGVGSSFTPANAITAGHGYTIEFGAFASTISAVTATNGDTIVKAVEAINTTDGNMSAVWYCLSSAGGSPTINITSDGTVAYTFSEWNQAISGVRSGGTNHATGHTAGPSSGASSSASVGDLGIGVICTGGGNTFTSYPNSGFTDMPSNVPDITVSEYNPVASAGALTCSATLGGSDGWSAVIVVFQPVASGTNFSQTVTDLTGLTDTAAQAATTVRPQTDTAGSTDVAVQASAAVRAQTDPAGSTDSITQAPATTKTQTDSTGLADNLAQTAATVRASTDTAGLTDTSAQTAAASRAQTDTSGLTDTLTAAHTWLVAITDDTGSTDTDQPQSVAYADTQTDQTGLTDTTSQQSSSTGAQTVTDNAGLTDSIVQQSVTNYAITITDTAGLADALAREQDRILTDLAGTADQVGQVANVAQAYSDGAGLTDVMQQQSSGAGTATFTDDTGLTDTPQAGTAYVRVITDDAGSTDLVGRGLGRTISDDTGSTDLLVQGGTINYVITITDSAGLTDVFVQPTRRDIDLINIRLEPDRFIVSLEPDRFARIALEGP